MGMTLKELLTKGEGTLSAQEAKALAAQCRMDVDTLYTLLEERGIKILEEESEPSLDVDSIIAEVENAENNNDDMGLADENEEDAEENPADLKAAMDELLDDPVKNYLKQIGQIPLLSAEQEVELSRRIHAGAEAAHILQADRQKYDAPEYIKKNSARFSFEEDENSRSYTEDLDEDGEKSAEDAEEKADEEKAMEAVENGPLSEERRLQRALRRMDDRDDYESAVAAGMLGRDQSGKGYIALDFFNIFWLFTIASVGGLIVETIYHMALYNGELQDRAGLLWGPFSPIYGCGAVLVTVCLNRLWKANPFLIFCASAVIGGAFEYCTSWFMEAAFGITAWDYTGRWLSIDGRTSGRFMFFWGLIGVVWVKWLLPRLLALINRIPWKVRYSLTAVCTVLMVIDIAFTLMALDCWYGRMAGQPQDSPVAMWFSERYSDAYMANRFQTMHIDPSKAGRM